MNKKEKIINNFNQNIQQLRQKYSNYELTPENFILEVKKLCVITFSKLDKVNDE